MKQELKGIIEEVLEVKDIADNESLTNYGAGSLRVDSTHSFFEDSLSAMRIVNAVSDRLQVQIPIDLLLNQQTNFSTLLDVETGTFGSSGRKKVVKMDEQRTECELIGRDLSASLDFVNAIPSAEFPSKSK